MTGAPAGPRRRLRASPLGLYLGGLICALTFTPSLIPRPWEAQGALAGLGFALGYGGGVLIARLWAWLELPVASDRRGRPLFLALCAVTAVQLGYHLWQAAEWQDSTRLLMGMAPLEDAHLFKLVGLGALVALGLLGLGWAISAGIGFAARFPLRYARRRWVAALGALVFIAALAIAVNDTLLSRVITLIDEIQAAADTRDPPGARPPAEATRSGGPGSLTPWDALGSAGKRFVHEGPRAADIAALTGRPAKAPIRVYVGLRAADGAEAQARLALAELRRAGAFDRSVLVIATPTGTGWLDDNGIAPVEYLHDGDTAVAGVQYSYLASPQSLILEPGRAQASAATVFEVIHDHWKSLPKETRPALYLFGLSLGAFGSESSPMMFSFISDPFQGAVWAGPTFRNPLWRRIIADRDAGSPAWQPVFEGGRLVRVLTPPHGFNVEDPEEGPGWGPIRIAYVAYPSDAIVHFEEDMWFRRPDWASRPRGADVSEALTWRPVVTFFQVALDMLLAVNAPPGHGHNYAAADYIDAWAAVSRPDAPAEEVARIKAAMAPR